jgi:hypothetical protein
MLQFMLGGEQWIKLEGIHAVFNVL